MILITFIALSLFSRAAVSADCPYLVSLLGPPQSRILVGAKATLRLPGGREVAVTILGKIETRDGKAPAELVLAAQHSDELFFIPYAQTKLEGARKGGEPLFIGPRHQDGESCAAECLMSHALAVRRWKKKGPLDTPAAEVLWRDLQRSVSERSAEDAVLLEHGIPRHETQRFDFQRALQRLGAAYEHAKGGGGRLSDRVLAHLEAGGTAFLGYESDGIASVTRTVNGEPETFGWWKPAGGRGSMSHAVTAVGVIEQQGRKKIVVLDSAQGKIVLWELSDLQRLDRTGNDAFLVRGKAPPGPREMPWIPIPLGDGSGIRVKDSIVGHEIEVMTVSPEHSREVKGIVVSNERGKVTLRTRGGELVTVPQDGDELIHAAVRLPPGP